MSIQETFRIFKPINLPTHAHPLVKTFFAEINKQQTTVALVSRKSGLSYMTMHSWREKAGPTLANLDAALGALGLELCVRKIESK